MNLSEVRNVPVQVRMELLNPSEIVYDPKDFENNPSFVFYDPMSQTSNIPLNMNANTKTSPTTTTMLGADNDNYMDMDF